MYYSYAVGIEVMSANNIGINIGLQATQFGFMLTLIKARKIGA